MDGSNERVDDLIARAKKYARGAGEIQEGQRRVAESVEHLSRWLSWASTVLSAAVGTSIIKNWTSEEPILFGLAAITAAVLSALQRTSKLEERAEDHRVVAAEYGGLRRRIDMLRIRLEGGDVKRKAGLAELKQIVENLSALGKKARPLPDSIYLLAAESFENSHQEYYSNPPTHAGGVVFRKGGETIEYLVVQALRKPFEWVLPKGHIKQGESPEQAARREVLEETGVVAAIRDVLDEVEYVAPKGPVKGQFFLMEAVEKAAASERREQKWLKFDEAIQKLQYKESQQLVCRAHVMIQYGSLLTGKNLSTA